MGAAGFTAGRAPAPRREKAEQARQAALRHGYYTAEAKSERRIALLSSACISEVQAPPTASPSLGADDEMDEAHGDGWAELQRNGSLRGQICFRPPRPFFNNLLTELPDWSANVNCGPKVRACFPLAL
jgi:hypothetical protein